MAPLDSPSEAPLDAVLDAALEELGLLLSRETRQRLLDLVELVHTWSARMNLTGHRGRESILRGLVIEGLALERVLPRCSTLLDLGSGAGFPGLPIAIRRGPDCRITLLDARERRHHFQRAAIRELGLDHVTALLGRAEFLPAVPHQIVVAQALARPLDAVRLATRWVMPGGRMALAVSRPPPAAEISGAIEGPPRAVRYTVPISGSSRVLWLATPRSPGVR